METGTVKLKNTKQYPFNDSAMTVALRTELCGTDYFVQTEIISADGEVGEFCVFDKAVNGFKIAFDGSAKSAELRYFVTGGGEK